MHVVSFRSHQIFKHLLKIIFVFIVVHIHILHSLKLYVGLHLVVLYLLFAMAKIFYFNLNDPVAKNLQPMQFIMRCDQWDFGI